MEIAIFAKKRTTRDGKKFYAYLSTLTRKDGSTLPVSVRFREEGGVPKPETCPIMINIPKGKANLSQKPFTREDTGEQGISSVLWVSEWKKCGEYVDHSLDDFE